MSKKTDIMAALTPYVESVTKDLTIGETIIPIKIKPLITPKMRATIVNEVGQHIDDGDGRNFGLVDWAFRSAVVKICTDLHISLDGGFEAALLYKTDIYALIAEVIGEAEKIVDITVAIDKLDKIGLDNVNEELRNDGISEDAIEKLQPIISLSGTNDEKLEVIAKVLEGSEVGLKGVEETKFILDTLKTLGLNNEIELDLTLARGLNYYTGAIFEVKALDTPMGSITGGGRYDNLTGIFGLPGLSGVGISFGADRIYDVLGALDLYPKEAVNATQVLFINFGEKETAYCLPIVSAARAAGIRTEIFPDKAKMKKQMSYANAKNIPFVVLAGENEMAQGKVTLKNMETGEQTLVTAEELIAKVNK